MKKGYPILCYHNTGVPVLSTIPWNNIIFQVWCVLFCKFCTHSDDAFAWLIKMNAIVLQNRRAINTYGVWHCSKWIQHPIAFQNISLFLNWILLLFCWNGAALQDTILVKHVSWNDCFCVIYKVIISCTQIVQLVALLLTIVSHWLLHLTLNVWCLCCLLQE